MNSIDTAWAACGARLSLFALDYAEPVDGGCRHRRPTDQAVHEAGHALGLSNVDYPIISDQQSYEAPPTIPDAVMNYDSRKHIRFPVGSGFSEPDCSPHPYDILALYALYQSADP